MLSIKVFVYYLHIIKKNIINTQTLTGLLILNNSPIKGH